MNKKLHSLLFTIGFIIPIEEESSVEKRNYSSVIVSTKANSISNIFKDYAESRIGHHILKKNIDNSNFKYLKTCFQQISNNSYHLLNEINLNLNHQNMVSQPT